MRKQSVKFTNASAYAIRIGELYRLAWENAEDPWFQSQVSEYLDGEGFYYYPELDQFGMLSVDPAREWVRSDDPEAERKAWVLAANVCQNGWRRIDRERQKGEGA